MAGHMLAPLPHWGRALSNLADGPLNLAVARPDRSNGGAVLIAAAKPNLSTELLEVTIYCRAMVQMAGQKAVGPISDRL